LNPLPSRRNSAARRFELKIALARFLRQTLIRDHSGDEGRTRTQDFEIIFRIFTAGQRENADVLAPAAEWNQDSIDPRDQLRRWIAVENLRRDELLALRDQPQMRVTVAEIDSTAFKGRVPRECVEDRIAMHRGPLQLLQIVNELGEAADQWGHGIREDSMSLPVAGDR